MLTAISAASAADALPMRPRTNASKRMAKLTCVFSLFLALSFAIPARAMSVDAKQLKGWKINDLTKLPFRLRLFMHGAEATIIPSEGPPIPTIFVFKDEYKGREELGTSVRAWDRFVRSIAIDKGAFRNEAAYEADGQTLFYTEILKYEDLLDGQNSLNTALLFVKSGIHMMMFEYSDYEKEFQANLKKVKELYHRIKIVK